MAEKDQDDSQKTEEPTPKRLQEARDKGDVAKSQEVNHWFMLSAFALTLAVFAPGVMRELAEVMLPFFSSPHDLRFGNGDILLDLVLQVAAILALPIALFLAAAIAGGMIQHGLIFSAENLKPKLSKISLIEGTKRLFSAKAIAEFIKGIAKITIVGAVIFLVVYPDWPMVEIMPKLGFSESLWLMLDEAVAVLIGVIAVMAAIAGLDFMFQRFQHTKKLRMSRQDIRDEMKQAEGDPMVKARLRQIRTERARQRMMAAVPEADVVITNPTHFSVALSYKMEEMAAPRVVAKGIDHIALKIREVAKEHDIMLVENRPLARALYDGVEIEQEIPPEHYKAVAEVIGYVMRLKGTLRPQS